MSALDFENLIQKNIKGLPLPILKEILDFTLFLKEKKDIDDYTSEIQNELKNLNNNEIEHLEEEFKDYEKLYPYENE